jgi:trimethylamine--corrinoid protein Co-methyltransferase
MRELVEGGQLRILENEELDRIHYSILEVLEKTGVKIESEEARKILADAGCEVNQKKEMAYIPGYLVAISH